MNVKTIEWSFGKKKDIRIFPKDLPIDSWESLEQHRDQTSQS